MLSYIWMNKVFSVCSHKSQLMKFIGMMREFAFNFEYLIHLIHNINLFLQKQKLGTFLGVFLPCIQNIFGVLLFVRMPWIGGVAGALQFFLMVGFCCLCVSLLFKLYYCNFLNVPLKHFVIITKSALQDLYLGHLIMEGSVSIIYHRT